MPLRVGGGVAAAIGGARRLPRSVQPLGARHIRHQEGTRGIYRHVRVLFLFLGGSLKVRRVIRFVHEKSMIRILEELQRLWRLWVVLELLGHLVRTQDVRHLQNINGCFERAK